MKQSPLISRRRFLGQASCAAVGSASLLSALLNLRMASTAAAESLPVSYEDDDYKALVCLFFSGGIDSYNMLVPRGEAYNEYAAVRGRLALPEEVLLPINPLNDARRPLGVHPGLASMNHLFNQGQAAWLANVGTMIEPVTREHYQNGTARLPLGLFSHSDQIRQWQTSVPQSTGAVGWGGRTADLLASLNDNQKISMNISVVGSNVWQSGNKVFEYAITPNGSVARDSYNEPWGANPARSTGIDKHLDQTYLNLFERTFAKVSRDAIDSHHEFSAAVDAQPELQTVFPANNNLAGQLRMVARTIAAHRALGFKRQTFMVQVDGWDHHDEVMGPMADMVPLVSDAIAAFYQSLEELGKQDQVTLFTGSDFGRTLTTNGQGSDHAWGGNHLVVGGAVRGNRIYGSYPDLYIGNPLDTGRGRLIPSTSVDAYFAELALWFGVPASELETVLPNINNFYTPGAEGPLGMFA